VAQLDNKLFVLACKKDVLGHRPGNKQQISYLLVYGSDNEVLENIKLNELESPRNMVVCPDIRLLYIADLELSRDQTGSIWQVSIDTKNVKRLPTASTIRPYALSVTSQRLLVTSVKPNELFLLASDGKLLERVPLVDLKDVQHAVETSLGTFIVCGGGDPSDASAEGQLVEVDIDGHVIRKYSEHQQLELPFYLSHAPASRLVVSGRFQVLLLNSQLQLERILLDKKTVKRPSKATVVYTTIISTDCCWSSW
jgi:hypothetical protein